METTLTLQLDQEVIEQATRYAHHKQQSLSALVEHYFRFLIIQNNAPDMPEISPIVQQLSGILETGDEQKFRDEYTDYLIRKYQP